MIWGESDRLVWLGLVIDVQGACVVETTGPCADYMVAKACGGSGPVPQPPSPPRHEVHLSYHPDHQQHPPTPPSPPWVCSQYADLIRADRCTVCVRTVRVQSGRSLRQYRQSPI